MFAIAAGKEPASFSCSAAPTCTIDLTVSDLRQFWYRTFQIIFDYDCSGIQEQSIKIYIKKYFALRWRRKGKVHCAKSLIGLKHPGSKLCVFPSNRRSQIFCFLRIIFCCNDVAVGCARGASAPLKVLICQKFGQNLKKNVCKEVSTYFNNINEIICFDIFWQY